MPSFFRRLNVKRYDGTGEVTQAPLPAILAYGTVVSLGKQRPTRFQQYRSQSITEWQSKRRLCLEYARLLPNTMQVIPSDKIQGCHNNKQSYYCQSSGEHSMSNPFLSGQTRVNRNQIVSIRLALSNHQHVLRQVMGFAAGLGKTSNSHTLSLITLHFPTACFSPQWTREDEKVLFRWLSCESLIFHPNIIAAGDSDKK